MRLTTVRAAPARLNEPLLLALARARVDGRSAYKIAADADAHPSDLSRWMNGRRTPSAEQQERLAAALGCSVAEIFPLSDVKPGGQPGFTENNGVTAPHAES